MKVVALVSGGKDSCYAMMRCVDYGHEIVALANLLPLDDSVDELDSYMYQTVGHQVVAAYAECMGLPLFRRRIQGSTRDKHLDYKATTGDEVEDMYILLSEVKQKIPSISAVSSGAIASDYQRLRVESVCSRLGLVSLAYLWKKDQTLLLEEMVQRGIVAITVKVAALGLNPAKHLGKEIADLQSSLLQLHENYGINVCGEGGEYESLTLDCPLFLAARNNVLLAVPALLYAINNYLKFIMQLYFNPATVKMLSNLKVLVIAVLLKMIMKRRFSIIQWEALALLLIGISINQLRSLPNSTTTLLPVATGAYLCTLIFVTVPSMASVFNEYALKSQFETSIYLQNLFLYGYGALFNFLGIVIIAIFKGPSSFDILQGHSRATVFLMCNNAAQGILSSFFFKYADTILKKYSSTVATIFTGIASAALFGHTLTINFILGISIVFISMHQFFSPLSKPRDEMPNGAIEALDVQNHRGKEVSFISMTAGANDDASHHIGSDVRQPLLPT